MTLIEKIGNCSLILASLVFVASTGRNYLQSKSSPKHPLIRRGASIKVAGIPPAAASGSTLLLALSTNCHYCKEGLPFYGRLSKLRKFREGNARLVAVFPEGQADGESFLRLGGVSASAVISASLVGSGVPGTPTFLLLDGTNHVQQVWFGELKAPQEQELISMFQ